MSIQSDLTIGGGLEMAQKSDIKELNIVIAGVGGQGNILASEIFAAAAVKAGYKVRVGETFGAAQRGGPVASYVRIGGDVYGPIVDPGSVSLIVGFEPMEALRNAFRFLAPGGIVIMNTRPMIPLSVSMGKDRYPTIEEIKDSIKKLGAKRVIAFDATKKAEELGYVITMNIVMLGALAGSGILPFSPDVVRDIVKERFSGSIQELNLKAFEVGFDAARAGLTA